MLRKVIDRAQRKPRWQLED